MDFSLIFFFAVSTASLFAVPYQDIHMSVTLRTNVNNTNQHMWYPTISMALQFASNNNTIVVYHGTYHEAVKISKFTNLTLISREAVVTPNQLVTNSIIDATGFSNAVTITNSTRIKVIGFLVRNAITNGIGGNMFSSIGSGIYLRNTTFSTLAFNKITHNQANSIFLSKNAQNNEVFRNALITNNGSGVLMISNGYNIVQSNDIEKNALSGQGYSGISVIDATNNIILNNTRIANNFNTGVGLFGSPRNNRLQGNTIFSNNGSGIGLGITNYRGNLRNNIITNNIIKQGSSVGIDIEVAKANQILNNIITYNNNDGILIRNGGSTNILIQNNLIKSNGFANAGIDIQVASTITNRLNSIIGQEVGIRYAAAGTIIVAKNNFISDWTNFDNLTGSAVKLTNNWWNFTVAASNAKRIAGNGLGYTNFMPYRIFGAFDITPGADTTALPIITWMTSLPGVTTATLRWNKPSSVVNFARYFVFRSQTPGVTNLTAAAWGTNNVNGTNYIDTPPVAGTWYYHVTSLDTPNPYTILTNESWYSLPVTGAMAMVGSYSIIATNTNLSYSGLAFNFQTTSNVIWITNNGSLPCKVLGQVNDFTNLPGPYVWKVTNGATAINQMQVRYSVFTNGVQSAWTLVPNMGTTVTLTPSLPLTKKMFLYIEIVTPTASSTLGPYKSRFRVIAHQ